MLRKCCTQYASKFGKLSCGHRTGKVQFSFQSQRKENAKEWSDYCTVTLISHTSKVMLKILQARLWQYMRNQRSNCQHPLDHRKSKFQKIYFCFIDYTKAFDCVDHNKLWNILKEMRLPDHLTCLLRNLCAGQEATVRTRHETTHWFQIDRRVCQGCMLSPCLFNFYAEYIMWNAGLDEAQAGIKIARRNINNLRYADDTTLMAKSEEEEPLDESEREEWKSWFRTQRSEN